MSVQECLERQNVPALYATGHPKAAQATQHKIKVCVLLRRTNLFIA